MHLRPIRFLFHCGPGDISTDSLLKFGYLPIEKQALCLVCENGDIDIRNRRMDNLFLELR